MIKLFSAAMIALLLSSCSIFKHQQKNSSSSESDSSSVTQNETQSVDSSQYTSYRRWSFMLPPVALNGISKSPFIPGFPPALGQSVAELNDAMQDLRSGYASPWLLPGAGYIPVVFEQYDTGKKGVSESKKESSDTQVKKEDDAKEVESTPDYSWIPYLIGSIVVIVFVVLVVRKWF